MLIFSNLQRLHHLRDAANHFQLTHLPTAKQLARIGLRTLYRLLSLSDGTKQDLRYWVLSTLFGVSAAALNRFGEPIRRPFKPKRVHKEKLRREAHSALRRYLNAGSTLSMPQSPEGTPPRVSIIIVLHNQAGLTLQCLQALSQCRETALETLIIDNASTDETMALMASVSGVCYFRNHENLHFLRAVNQAAERARGEYLLLLNNDAVLLPGALEQAIRRLGTSPTIGAVGAKILLPDGSLQEAGSIIWRDGSCLGYGRSMDPEAGPYQFVRKVDYCSGAFLLTRRALFAALGGFDTRFVPAYYEETDYCVRLQEAGYDILYDPQVQVRHFEFASSTSSHSALALQRRNQHVFCEKHADFLARQAPALPANIPVARQRLPAGCLRILMIDDRVPHKHLGTGCPRANLIIRSLAEQGHAVTLYPLQFPMDEWNAVYQSLPDTVEVMLQSGKTGLEHFLASHAGHYDVVLISRPHNMAFLQSLLSANPDLMGNGATAPRLVYDAEAVFALREQIQAAVKHISLSPADAEEKLHAELSLTRPVQTVLAVSEAEARHFRQTGAPHVAVLGHSIEIHPTATPFAARSRFLFVGAMPTDDSPNADSVVWFAQQVWPLIRTALGENAAIDIVGVCHAPSVRDLTGEGIHIHGPVDSLDGFFEQARVFIVPTRYAAGIPHKAHEAASRGVPMVTTSLIAEQLGWEEDAICIADSPAAFAKHCLALFTREDMWEERRERSLQRVQTDCSPERFRSTLAAAINTHALR
jgi:GT2 family glycosyltransferase